MNKRGGVVFLLLFAVLLGVALWMLYSNMPGKEVNLTVVNPPEVALIEPPSAEVPQFYNSMRFPDALIGYEIESACSKKKKEQIEEAFDILESRTLLVFEESNSGYRIIITCSELAPEPTLKGHFVAGEGGPTEIINASAFMVIQEGKIALYRSDSCDSSHVALHELLHALGFDHSSDSQSIMYPTLECDQILDEDIIDQLNDLYSIESLPDLAISNVEATKSGPYIGFEITIINQGLASVDNSVLDIYADEDLIKSFDLDELDIGTRKTLTVENLRASRGAHNITFSVRTGSSQERELENDNNQIVLENVD